MVCSNRSGMSMRSWLFDINTKDLRIQSHRLTTLNTRSQDLGSSLSEPSV